MLPLTNVKTCGNTVYTCQSRWKVSKRFKSGQYLRVAESNSKKVAAEPVYAVTLTDNCPVSSESASLVARVNKDVPAAVPLSSDTVSSKLLNDGI